MAEEEQEFSDNDMFGYDNFDEGEYEGNEIQAQQMHSNLGAISKFYFKILSGK